MRGSTALATVNNEDENSRAYNLSRREIVICNRVFQQNQKQDLIIPLEIASGDAVLYALCL